MPKGVCPDPLKQRLYQGTKANRYTLVKKRSLNIKQEQLLPCPDPLNKDYIKNLKSLDIL